MGEQGRPTGWRKAVFCEMRLLPGTLLRRSASPLSIPSLVGDYCL